MDPVTKESFLSTLIGGKKAAAATADTAQPHGATPSPGVSTATPKPRRTPAAIAGWYDRLGMTGALLFVAMFALGMWWVGAYFTLQFLTRWGVPTASWGLWAWAIPLSITLSELWLWPARQQHRAFWLVWVIVLAFDVGSTTSGLVAVLAGRYIDLFAGFTLPATGPLLVGLAGVIGLLCAFGPEHLGKQASTALYELWK